MVDVAKSIFKRFGDRQRAYEGTLALFGVLALQSQISRKYAGPEVLTFESYFRDYASMLERLRIARPAVSSNRYALEPRPDGDFDLYIPSGDSGLGSLGIAPIGWVIIVGGISLAYKGFDSLSEYLRSRAQEENRKFSKWLSDQPKDLRKEIMSQPEFKSASSASSSIWGEIASSGRGIFDAGIGIAVALTGILIFRSLYDTREKME